MAPGDRSLTAWVTPADVLNQFAALRETCRHRSVELIGGHTGIVPGLARPILVGMMLGDAAPHELRAAGRGPARGRPADHEGARHRRNGPAGQRTCRRAAGAGRRRDLVRAAARLMDEPGISIVAEAEIARRYRGGHRSARSDRGRLRERGRELAIVSGAGVEIDAEAIPILDETRAVAEALGIDPLGMLASGSLLIATRAEGVPRIVRDIESAGIPVAVVGRLTGIQTKRRSCPAERGGRCPSSRSTRSPGCSPGAGTPILVPCFTFMSLLLVGSVNAHVGFRDGMDVLRSGGSAIDAVVAAIRKVEANPDDHSVGFGGLPNLEGEVELDASIMDGRTLATGAVAALHGYQDAIALARVVMDELPHVLVVGSGASRLAGEAGFQPQDLLTPEARVIWESPFTEAGHRGRLSGKDARACRAIEPGSRATRTTPMARSMSLPEMPPVTSPAA